MTGVIGGTSFLRSGTAEQGELCRVVTPWGSVAVTITDSIALIARHGPEGYNPPHRINHHAHIAALGQLGVKGAVSVGSVGSLRTDLVPGSVVVADDFYSPFVPITYHNDQLKFTVPGFDRDWREGVLRALRGSGIDAHDGGVYAQTVGPRFETVAETGKLAGCADVVGMTCASEAVLANEKELPHAIVAIVDNFANGICAEPLSGDGFQKQVEENRALALRVLNAFVLL